MDGVDVIFRKCLISLLKPNNYRRVNTYKYLKNSVRGEQESFIMFLCSLPESDWVPGQLSALADAQVRTHRHDRVQDARH